MLRQIGPFELIIIGCVCLSFLAAVGAVVYFFSRRFDHRRRHPCPHCAELILPEATVCRFCGRDVPAEEASQQPDA